MQYWALTDTGVARSQNQDAYQVVSLDKNTLLCVVCDGMGGAKSGNVASTLAADVFTQEVKRSWVPDMDPESLDRMLGSAVKLANFTVYDQANQFEDFNGMGTTLVALLIQGKKATIVNVGDSRAYLIDSDGIKQVTTDHSLVQMMIARGELAPEKAKHYPGKNLITRAIGTEPQVVCDVFHRKVEKGACFLLCTDGFWEYVYEEEMEGTLRRAASPQQWLEEMTVLLRSRTPDDNDNFTAAAVFC